MAITTKDEAYEVFDSTDWLETPLPSLAPLDSALRCQVCRDYYTTPMITSCSHTFCSLCIRHCLGNDGKCPACRKKDDSSKLRNNHTIEDLVEAFKRARPEIMHFTKAKEAARVPSPKRKRVEEEVKDDSYPVRKRTRSARRTQQSHSPQPMVVLDSDGDDEDYVPEEVQKSGIQCPLCHDYFPTVPAVEAHLDHCNGQPPSQKQNTRPTQTSIRPQQVSKPTKRPDRLPQLHYGTLKDNALGKKLHELGLSMGGSRQLMEKRYTEWVTIWNANCDARNPKGKTDLKREMDVWERTQGGGAQFANRGNVGLNIRDKDFDQSAYSSKHDDSFRQLIEEAKRKRAAKVLSETTSKPEGSGVTQMTTEMQPPVPYSSPNTTQSSTGLEKAMPDVSFSMNELGNETSGMPKSSSLGRIPQGTGVQASTPAAFEPPSLGQGNKALGLNSDVTTVRPVQP